MAKKQLPFKYKSLILLVMMIGSLSFLSLSSSGILRYFEAKKEKEASAKKELQLEQEIKDLEHNVELLQDCKTEESKEMFEKVAREKYQMAKPDEKVYKINTK